MTAALPSIDAPPARGLAARIAFAGLAGGAVDFFYANAVALTAGKSLASPWRGVASGWIGAAAREGAGPVALGLVTHFAVASCMAAAFVLAARRMPLLGRRPLGAGVAYGLLLYLLMYRVVLPLRWPETFPKWDGTRSLLDIAAHVGVGLAIAWVAARGERAPIAGQAAAR
ncbi:hypothetical protein [Phenylobacterium sp.]|uniref:hypothetical protein n=1 Tax=Phenylobacterium sp. TaxID=1871053 RepID=UPI0025D8ABE0|nr:hypothetical protein [Phenylobacterium sp.]